MKSDEIAVELTNIHKKYRIYGSPLSRMKEWITFGKIPTHYEFWALKNINLKVKKGEALGIIGENGSGKSTMLKIIAGTSWPTIGTISTQGRISAMLELGAGFHPDFTGKQNIFINARLMGLSDEEVKERFDEIVRFAELGKFINSPVRTYSSGMYVRLGFAVASSVSPDILIVDEALSVGDDYFQKKSIDRIKKFRDEGVTVLFVSHAMPHITRFCDRVIWLREGIIEAEGEAREIVNEYQRYCYRHTYERLMLAGKKEEAEAIKPEEEPILEDKIWGSGKVKFTRVLIINSKGEETWSLDQGEDITVRLYYYAFQPVTNPIFGLNIHTIQGVYIYGTNNYNIHPQPIEKIEGHGYIDFHLADMRLHKGKYFLSCMVFDEPDDPYWQNPCDWHNQAYEFMVFAPTEAHGLVAFSGKWDKVKKISGDIKGGVPSKIDLSDSWHFHFMDSGWYKPEKDPSKQISYSWSKETGGFLLLQIKNSERLRLKVRAANPNIKKEPLEVECTVDGKSIGRFRLSGTDWQDIELKIKKATEDLLLYIKLIPGRTWHPFDAGISDERKLGIALSTADFR